MIDIVLSIVSWLAGLSLESSILISLIGIVLSLLPWLTSIKTLKSSYEKKHATETNEFLKHCKPFANEVEPTNHEIILLEQSYYQLTKNNLDIALLQRISKGANLRRKILHFTNAGHLIITHHGHLIEKEDNVIIKTSKNIFKLLIFLIINILIVFNLVIFPNMLNTQEESNKIIAITFISISVLVFYTTKKLINYLDRTIDVRQSKKWLLKNA